ncbi:hypothetical protein CVCC1112_1493 [Paenarthrobacter nicotinovorans]|nr:hypothetical protein CVCC1112_1493 [Paenarthrobacter nicotinovorans]
MPLLFLLSRPYISFVPQLRGLMRLCAGRLPRSGNGLKSECD